VSSSLLEAGRGVGATFAPPPLDRRVTVVREKNTVKRGAEAGRELRSRTCYPALVARTWPGRRKSVIPLGRGLGQAKRRGHRLVRFCSQLRLGAWVCWRDTEKVRPA
jgi:hypothetical protein